tara:strand:+ start:212 stop:412 length:201 start_codon:yes stop_codon:yes gene_type:complete
MIKVGDIVRIIDGHIVDDHRKLGAVMRRDIYRSSSYGKDSVIEVAWSSSAIGWILESRLEVVSEAR